MRKMMGSIKRVSILAGYEEKVMKFNNWEKDIMTK